MSNRTKFQSASWNGLGLVLGCDSVIQKITNQNNRISFLSISKRYLAHVLALKAHSSTYFTNKRVCTFAGSVCFRDVKCECHNITHVGTFPARVGTGQAPLNKRHDGYENRLWHFSFFRKSKQTIELLILAQNTRLKLLLRSFRRVIANWHSLGGVTISSK